MAAMDRIILAAILASGALCGSCQIQQRLNGDYEGMRSIQVNPGTDPVVARQLALVRLTARPDGKAFLSDQGIPIEGEISYGAKSATFTAQAISGAPVAFEQVSRYTHVLTPAANGSWMMDGILLKPRGTP